MIFSSWLGGLASQSLVMAGKLVVGVMIPLNLQALDHFRSTCCQSWFPPPAKKGVGATAPTNSGIQRWPEIIF